MKFSLYFLFLFLQVFLLSAQKEGKYLSETDPLNTTWEFDIATRKDVEENEESEEEYVEGDGAPMVGDMGQQFFFLVGGESDQNMMAPFEMEGMGFACPSYFQISKDTKFLYLKIGQCCQLDLPESEKYVKVGYKLHKEIGRLILTYKGKDYVYKKWKS
jgi:hypothetical protein